MIASASMISAGNGRYLTSAIQYYADGKGESKGRWGGNFAHQLNLENKIEHNDKRIDDLFSGKLQGQTLRQIGSVRHTTLEDGTEKLIKPVRAIDVTFSAPKDISLLCYLSDEETRQKILEAHQKAVDTALSYLEQNLAHIRVNGRIEKANLIYGIFNHTTSREQDPQLHDHVLIMNTAQGVESGKVRALDARPILKNLYFLGSIYRTELEKQIREMGYETERVKLEKGYSFNVSNAGITQPIRDHFSKRSDQIKQMLEAEPTLSKQEATLKSRVAKEKQVDKAALFERWQKEASDLGLDLSQLKKEPKINKEEDKEKAKEAFEQDVLKGLQKKEGFTAITEKDVVRQAFIQAPGVFSSAERFTIAEHITKTHLREIARPGAEDRGDQTPVHLKSAEKSALKQAADQAKKVVPEPYAKRVTEGNERRAQAENSRGQVQEEKQSERIYTLSCRAKSTIQEKDSLYSKLRFKLAPKLNPLARKLLPEGKPLSYQWKRKQYLKAKERFEKRQKQFQRKAFTWYMQGRITHRQFVRYTQGDKSKSKLMVNLRWILGDLSKGERKVVLKRIDKEKEQKPKREQSRYRTVILEVQEKSPFKEVKDRPLPKPPVKDVSREAKEQPKEQNVQLSKEQTNVHERDISR